MFPIKYIENNLVFNHDGECFAYYELTPYNYSFLSPEEKYMVQKILGHSQIDTTMQYAMVNQNNVKSSHQKYMS